MIDYYYYLQPKQINFLNIPVLSEKMSINFDSDIPTFRFHVPFNIQSNVFLSGGLDSCVIAFLLLKSGISPKFYTIIDKAFIPQVNVLVDYLQSIFPSIQIQHKFIERSQECISRDGHSIRNFSTRFVYDYYPNAIFYDGCTNLPPKSFLNNIVQRFPNRPASKHYRAGDLTILDCEYGWYSPLNAFDKRLSVFLANWLMIDISLTWTCTQHPTIACGKCFACKEKKWAISEQDNFKSQINQIIYV